MIHGYSLWTVMDDEMFITCPMCGLTFQGEHCRSCVGKVKAYLCACGTRIPNHFWSGREEHNLIRKVNADGSLS